MNSQPPRQIVESSGHFCGGTAFARTQLPVPSVGLGHSRHAIDTSFVFLNFCDTRNVAVGMPDDLARKMRILAAEADVRMSQFLCNLVAEKAAAENTYETAMRRYFSWDRGGLQLKGQKLPTREEIYDRNALR